VQAIGTTAPDLPPAPARHACVSRDHEYVRRGTLSLLAGIDLLTGVVHASVEERHRSREFVAFLQKLDAAYPTSTAIKIIVDNHSAHVSKETKAWLATQPEGRFTFVLTPKHGSWLNLVEGFFSKTARSMLRHIRLTGPVTPIRVSHFRGAVHLLPRSPACRTPRRRPARFREDQ
jgi:transposase